MIAQKLKPEDCFQLKTIVKQVGDISNDITLENGWDIFSLPQISYSFKGKTAVVFYREKGEHAENTICGFKIENKVIFLMRIMTFVKNFIKLFRKWMSYG